MKELVIPSLKIKSFLLNQNGATKRVAPTKICILGLEENPLNQEPNILDTVEGD